MLDAVQWCSVCNERPADGTLTVLIDNQRVDIPCCLLCKNDPKKVEFID